MSIWIGSDVTTLQKTKDLQYTLERAKVQQHTQLVIFLHINQCHFSRDFIPLDLTTWGNTDPYGTFPSTPDQKPTVRQENMLTPEFQQLFVDLHKEQLLSSGNTVQNKNNQLGGTPPNIETMGHFNTHRLPPEVRIRYDSNQNQKLMAGKDFNQIMWGNNIITWTPLWPDIGSSPKMELYSTHDVTLEQRMMNYS